MALSRLPCCRRPVPTYERLIAGTANRRTEPLHSSTTVPQHRSTAAPGDQAPGRRFQAFSARNSGRFFD